MITEEQYQKHIEEAQKLTPQGYHALFAIKLKPRGAAEIQLNFSPKQALTWQGIEWQDYAVALGGFKMESSGETPRPALSLMNPSGLFSQYVHEKWTDNAEVVRYMVLKEHMSADVNSYVRHSWRISKTLNLTKRLAVFELRGAMDGQFFILPGRAYYPPEFPAVSLG